MLNTSCPRTLGRRPATPHLYMRPCRSSVRVRSAEVMTETKLETSSKSAPLQFLKAGPNDPAPSYDEVDKKRISKVVQALFRRKMVAAIGEEVPEQGYDGIISLTRRLNSPSLAARETQVKTVNILKSFFPAWLPVAFQIFFGRPFPRIACQMNALATKLSCEWLMGTVSINDVEIDDGTVGKAHGVLVERCRYLEESGCASICINSCKVPTQEFFAKTMGLPLTMTPNYEDFSCQFAFGKTPEPQSTDEAFSTPCFTQCPSKRKPSAEGSCCSGSCGGIVVDATLPKLIQTN